MQKCPVCHHSFDSPFCPICGYDRSADAELSPTLSPLSGAVSSVSARSPERLGRTVQLCDTGIAPGSGVGNDRRPLNREVLGVPVIGIGVPTVVDAVTLVQAYGQELPAEAAAGQPPMMVTPREIDLVIGRAARLVALAVNGALQPDYSPLELISVARGM